MNTTKKNIKNKFGGFSFFKTKREKEIIKRAKLKKQGIFKPVVAFKNPMYNNNNNVNNYYNRNRPLLNDNKQTKVIYNHTIRPVSSSNLHINVRPNNIYAKVNMNKKLPKTSTSRKLSTSRKTPQREIGDDNYEKI